MSLETFIRAMPKVEPYVHFEGAIPRDTLLMLAEENDIAGSMKPRAYNDLINALAKPDISKIDELANTYASWLKHAEDLVRVVYDMGLAFSRQNIRYAEINISPALYTDNGMAFEAFLEAINDGRDRVERAWKVKMNWILTIPRDRPRKGDDVAKWVTSATSRKNNVVGIGLSGREDAQPAGQFAKPFATVEKKGMGRIAHARTFSHVEPIQETLQALNPARITESWGIADDPETLEFIAQRDVTLVAVPVRELRLGRITSYAEYPLPKLLDHIKVTIGTGMPSLYHTTLTEEWVGLGVQHNLTLNELETLTRNAVSGTFLGDDEKKALQDEFVRQFSQLSAEHLAGA
jgi:adenosine deaminase